MITADVLHSLIRRQAWDNAILNGHLLENQLRSKFILPAIDTQAAFARYTVNAVDGSVSVVMEIGLQ